MTDQPSSTPDSARISAGQSCGSCGDPSCTAARRRPEESDQDFADRQKRESRLCRIRRKVVVLSGKGGVGKSTVAVNLAMALRLKGKRMGLLDADIHGPSVPLMLGLEGMLAAVGEGEIHPVDADGIKVISLGFFLQRRDDAVIWRGPMKMGVIRQFLQDAVWGDLDYLVVDSPPGTGDEPLSVCQLIGKLDGAVVVTTPQKVAAADVRRSITFCRQLKVPVLGVVENMSGFACPKCGEVTPIFRFGGGRALAVEMSVPFLGSIPIDPLLSASSDLGQVFLRDYAETPTAKIMQEIIRPILELDEKT
ncbi:MAG: Mrp/NBP35 family ATP-binding protein [candidate division Zixibacteria bacterium]|nr:Mrp/NBP35 family ATP-binding protein [candidate division Zixibacteria bacterium]